ncbi:hypothetical protein YC2023_030914 [Brassica napus]
MSEVSRLDHFAFYYAFVVQKNHPSRYVKKRQTNHVTLTWRNLTDSDSSNPCLSSSLLFSSKLRNILCFPRKFREKRKPLLIFLQDSAVNFADSESIVEMESPKVHEAGKVEETHQKVDPLTEDGEYAVTPSTQLRDFLLSNLNVTHPLEANGVFDFLVTILEVLPLWRSVEEPLSSKFEVYHQVAKKICNRCKLVTVYPVERSYGLIVVASSLREIKASQLLFYFIILSPAFKDFAFENILKVIRIALMMMTCDKEGCGKQNYVERVISKLPAVFTIAVEWEKNETEEDIFATTSVLATEIDISEIFKYEGDSLFTKYRLVSMIMLPETNSRCCNIQVCCHGDQYSCMAYENRSWVIHFGTQNEVKQQVSGDWNRVLSIFAKLKIRPEILLFENLKLNILIDMNTE